MRKQRYIIQVVGKELEFKPNGMYNFPAENCMPIIH